MFRFGNPSNPLSVAPFTGAWIEIRHDLRLEPSELVAPFTGAWIEILTALSSRNQFGSRTLHGCVD